MAQKQLQDFETEFDRADKDKSGSLSFDEVVAVLRSQGFKGNNAQAQCIFEGMDTDKSKSISRAEFSQAMKKLPQMDCMEFYLRKTFKTLDKDESGFLKLKEIQVASKTPGLPVDISNTKTFLLLCDLGKSEDEEMSYEEFLDSFKTEITGDRIKRIFERIDTDKSGFLTKAEMMKALESDVELKTTLDKIAGLIDELKTDADGKISMSEFIQYWCKPK